MEVKVHPTLASDRSAQAAATAIESCVHCGFCLATCPTYLDSRDERDSPRGRIYLLKELLEQGESDTAAQHHLDRCLTCRSCETTCPSGVRYGEIADQGRQLLEAHVPRSAAERLQRQLIRFFVPYPGRFKPLLRVGQAVRALLPRALRELVPPRQALLPPVAAAHDRQVLMLEGCVQSSATPRTNQAARLILDRLGISVTESAKQGCCGALDTHLGHGEAGRAAMRRNIDAWWSAVEAGAEAILSTATGCGTQLADYGHALANDPAYAEKAQRISELSVDFGNFLLLEDLSSHVKVIETRRVAVQIPCSQSHALKTPDTVRSLLLACGYTLTRTRDDHLCCGSAGSYSMLQPAMSGRLRERKLAALTGDAPTVIASANVGCQLHLAAASDVPVVHWTELIWGALA